jgi:all-trans-retinol dehydrogenase (NAD+)
MRNLEGKTAVITGGAGGIGAATARRLVREKVGVTLWDLNQDGLERVRDRLLWEFPDAQIWIRICDITKPAQIRDMTRLAENEMGRIDILVNNAGYLAPGNFLDQPVDAWIRTVEVNLHSLVYTIHEVLPGMYARNSGHIVNISSAAGTLGVPGLAVYAATKWAVWGLTESLRQESWNLNKKGVRYSSVHPNFIRSGMFAGASLKGVGAFLVPTLKNHDVIAQAIVEAALKRGRRCPKRPFTVRLAVLLRGILPNFLFEALIPALGVNRGMSTWTGPVREEPDNKEDTQGRHP